MRVGLIRLLPLQHPYPAVAGCNSDLAQYSITPSLRAAGFEDEDDDEDENEAPTGRILRRARLRPADTVSLVAGNRALALDHKRLNKAARQIGGSRIDHRHQILEAHLAQGSEVLLNRR